MENGMERLKRKYEKAMSALQTLKSALEDMGAVGRIAREAGESKDRLYKTFRDSLVQRFEYTFDTTWKCFAEYLALSGRVIEVKTPKSIFRDALKAGYLSEEEARIALQMVDERNLTTHGYNEQLIEAICSHIPEYYQVLAGVLLKIAAEMHW